MTVFQQFQIGGVVALFTAATLVAGASQQRTTQTPPVYDVATEVTLSGTVNEVQVIPGPGAQAGVHLMVKTTKETVEVDLGPEWFMTQQKYTLAKGDAVIVTGSRVKTGGTDRIIAREIKRGTDTMVFRDAKGFPKWSGRGR